MYIAILIFPCFQALSSISEPSYSFFYVHTHKSSSITLLEALSCLFEQTILNGRKWHKNLEIDSVK